MMFLKASISFLFLLTAPIALLYGQHPENDRLEELLRQQRTEEALPILEALHRNHPESEHHFDRLIYILIQMGEPKHALLIVETAMREGNLPELRLREVQAELLHRAGRRDDAMQAWACLMEEQRNNIALYYQVGNTMLNRGEHRLAIEHYQSGRMHFQNLTLFSNEIIGAYLQLGEMEKALGEYIDLVHRNPGREAYVRQRLREFREPRMLELAIEVTRNRLLDIDKDSPHLPHMQQFLLSLLVESGAYDEAAREAITYDQGPESDSEILLSLANDLESAHEYELAERLYRRSLSNLEGGARAAALDRLARLNWRWAKELNEQGLESLQHRSELYQNAFDYNLELLQNHPDFDYLDQVLVRLAMLSISPMTNTDQARSYLDQLRMQPSSDLQAEIYWIEGRIYQLEKRWREARHAFHRALEFTDQSDLATDIRFELGRTEFFEGDAEYALLQLGMLEQQSDSHVAGRALKMRLWIQETQRADTTGEALETFAGLIASLDAGEVEKALGHLDKLITKEATRLAGYALIELSATTMDCCLETILDRLVRFNHLETDSPVRERLLWQQAQLASLVWIREGKLPGKDPRPSLYEQLLIEFPQGFYTPHARRELQRLEQEVS